MMLIHAGFRLLSRLSRLARVDSDRWNLARKGPSLAPSATQLSRVRASRAQVSPRLSAQHSVNINTI